LKASSTRKAPCIDSFSSLFSMLRDSALKGHGFSRAVQVAVCLVSPFRGRHKWRHLSTARRTEVRLAIQQLQNGDGAPEGAPLQNNATPFISSTWLIVHVAPRHEIVILSGGAPPLRAGVEGSAVRRRWIRCRGTTDPSSGWSPPQDDNSSVGSPFIGGCQWRGVSLCPLTEHATTDRFCCTFPSGPRNSSSPRGRPLRGVTTSRASPILRPR
jgi:hypothetical protein